MQHCTGILEQFIKGQKYALTHGYKACILAYTITHTVNALCMLSNQQKFDSVRCTLDWCKAFSLLVPR